MQVHIFESLQLEGDLLYKKNYLSFLNTKSERSEREIKETILFIST